MEDAGILPERQAGQIKIKAVKPSPPSRKKKVTVRLAGRMILDRRYSISIDRGQARKPSDTPYAEQWEGLPFPLPAFALQVCWLCARPSMD